MPPAQSDLYGVTSSPDPGLAVDTGEKTMKSLPLAAAVLAFPAGPPPCQYPRGRARAHTPHAAAAVSRRRPGTCARVAAASAPAPAAGRPGAALSPAAATSGA